MSNESPEMSRAREMPLTADLEPNWGEIREFQRLAAEMETIPGAYSGEVRDHLRRMLRMSAAGVMEVASRTAASVPADVEEFVRTLFGGPPYPTLLDVMLEDPEFRKQYEAQAKK